MMDPKRIVAKAKIKYDPHVGKEYRSSNIIWTSWNQIITESSIENTYAKIIQKTLHTLSTNDMVKK